MRKFLFVLALACAAWSHAAAETTEPRSIGQPHICTRFFPDRLARLGGEGATFLSFDVDAQGRTQNLAVSKSSGVSELDGAAVRCASAWRYAPATKDGVAIEVPWTASVTWSTHPGATTTSPVPLGVHDCYNYTPLAVWAGAQGKTTVGFHIATDGSVKAQAVATSSGNADLDAASLTCVASWRYLPARHSGVAAEVEWRAAVEWKTNDIALVQAPSCRRYADATPRMLTGIGGATTVTYRVKPDGATSDVSVLRSSGSDVLDQAALRCMGETRMQGDAQLPAAGAVRAATIDWHQTPQ